MLVIPVPENAEFPINVTDEGIVTFVIEEVVPPTVQEAGARAFDGIDNLPCSNTTVVRCNALLKAVPIDVTVRGMVMLVTCVPAMKRLPMDCTELPRCIVDRLEEPKNA